MNSQTVGKRSLPGFGQTEYNVFRFFVFCLNNVLFISELNYHLITFYDNNTFSTPNENFIVGVHHKNKARKNKSRQPRYIISGKKCSTNYYNTANTKNNKLFITVLQKTKYQKRKENTHSKSKCDLKSTLNCDIVSACLIANGRTLYIAMIL